MTQRKHLQVGPKREINEDNTMRKIYCPIRSVNSMPTPLSSVVQPKVFTSIQASFILFSIATVSLADGALDLRRPEVAGPKQLPHSYRMFSSRASH